MKIAVIGAGFLGVACTYELAHLGDVTLFDSNGIGGGASGMAAGLLHPFAGKKATLNWMGLEGYDAAVKLLTVAEAALGTPVAYKTGIFRPACNIEQTKNFTLAAKMYPEHIQWQSQTQFDVNEGIFIPSGIQVDCPLYLEGLYKACHMQGSTTKKKVITTVDELSDFDLIVATVGCGFSAISGLEAISIHPVKGQLLEFSYDQLIDFAISSQCYVAQVRPGTLIAGSTYEHSWETTEADVATCQEHIRTKIADFSKSLASLTITGCKAGFRATTPDKKPFITKVNEKLYCLGGLGSKGLLYHALLAKQLRSKLCSK